jgi:hypothetical protein
MRLPALSMALDHAVISDGDFRTTGSGTENSFESKNLKQVTGNGVAHLLLFYFPSADVPGKFQNEQQRVDHGTADQFKK